MNDECINLIRNALHGRLFDINHRKNNHDALQGAKHDDLEDLQRVLIKHAWLIVLVDNL